MVWSGDLLQLDPVNEPSPFVEISKKQLTKYFTGLHIINLWRELFSYDELTQNVRQQSDLEFAKTLGHIRLGILDDADYHVLSKREIKLNNTTMESCLEDLAQRIDNLPPSTVCLFATREQCKRINEAMLKKIDGRKYALVATDEIEAKTEKQKERAKKSLELFKQKGKSSKTAGLEDRIDIKTGAKIMLLRNIDVPSGLVNGAIGTIMKVHEIVERKNGKEIRSVEKLTFKFEKEQHQLEPINSKFPLNQYAFITRRQFPICLAYAITIHKSQGLTLDSCVVDVGDSIFANGQTYVALSRLTSISGLYIVNLNPGSIKTNSGAIIEYNRLRNNFRQDLLPISVSVRKNRVVSDRNRYFRKQIEVSF